MIPLALDLIFDLANGLYFPGSDDGPGQIGALHFGELLGIDLGRSVATPQSNKSGQNQHGHADQPQNVVSRAICHIRVLNTHTNGSGAAFTKISLAHNSKERS